MDLKIVVGYYTVTLTKWSQLCKRKQFFQNIGKIKIKLTSSLTLYFAFRIFDSIRHHSMLSTFKNMCFRKGRICC